MFSVKFFALWAMPDKAMPLGYADTVSSVIDLLRTRYKVPALVQNTIKSMAYGDEWGEVLRLKSGRGSENVIIARSVKGVVNRHDCSCKY